jgi:hypothetical protein
MLLLLGRQLDGEVQSLRAENTRMKQEIEDLEKLGTGAAAGASASREAAAGATVTPSPALLAPGATSK